MPIVVTKTKWEDHYLFCISWTSIFLNEEFLFILLCKTRWSPPQRTPMRLDMRKSQFSGHKISFFLYVAAAEPHVRADDWLVGQRNFWYCWRRIAIAIVAATATSMLQTTSQKSTTAVLTYKRNEIYVQ